MNITKNNLIFIGSVIAFVVIMGAFFFFLSLEKNANKTEPTKEEQESLKYPEFPNREYVDLNKDLSQSYQDTFDKFKVSGKDFEEIIFKNKEDQSASLENFANSLKISIYPSVYKNLSQENYSVFFCSNFSNIPTKGIKLSFSPSATSDFYAKNTVIEKGMEDWQENLFYDTKNVFFPSDSLDKSTPPTFNSTSYMTENGMNEVQIKYGSITSKEGKELSLDYAILNEQVFISNNKECLRKALDYYQDSSEP